jgi:aminobenzoyl-glutamate utilization protein B
MSKETALSWIDENEKKIIGLSDKAWEYAEVGLLEYETAKLFADAIEKKGFSVERGVAGMPTAFVATWGSGSPTIGIMGELDALAGVSQKAVPYKDPVVEGGPGHGCGHNVHGASGLAGAIAIKTSMEANNIPGTVKFYGCPAEETLVGKVWLVRDGYFDGVDACLKHVIEKARIHYVTEVGGGQPNVVPAYARTWFYVRAPEREQVDYIYDWVLQIADGADKMARTTHDVEFLTGCYNMLPNKGLADLIVDNMRDIGAPTHTEEEMKFAKKLNESIPEVSKKEGLRKSERPGWEKMLDEHFDERVLDDYRAGKVGAGSTDVSDVSWVTPTNEFGTTCCILGTPGHSWQFTAQSGMSIGHKSLIFASKVIAGTGLDLMMDASLLKAVRDEWNERLAGRTYKPPIPADLAPPLDQLKKD